MIHSHIRGSDGRLVGSVDRIAGGYRVLWREPARDSPGRIHHAEREIHRSRDSLWRAVVGMDPGARIVEVK